MLKRIALGGALLGGVLLGLLIMKDGVLYAQTAGPTLEQQIDQTNAQIKQLQAEIAQLQSQLTTTAQQKQTLQNAIKALNLNIQKLQKSISLTQAQITQRDSDIAKLSTTIATTSSSIDSTENEVADSLRQLDQIDQSSLLARLLSGGTLSAYFDDSATISALRNRLYTKIEDLNALKNTLEDSKDASEEKRRQLASLQQNLNTQKQGLAITRDSQNQLLTETKNQETTYQAQLAKKRAQEAQFESDLQKFEAQLHLQFNPGTLPTSGSQPLAWPTDNVRITQYFGNTDFATKNPQIYNGHGHSGVDLAASPGTPIKAARAGVVLGTGNTDLTCPGASFGKWVFIEHNDGLSTLYAHLASMSVVQGQTVAAGDVVGLSDTTGYATGPHLHFGVYASAGSKIASFPSSSCKGKNYTMPVADLTAYLNPLSYLPPVP